MRYLLLATALIPSVLFDQYVGLKLRGYGRGTIIPPTVAELAEQKCLATMIYGEARGETVAGQVAVAYSAVNRAKGTKSLCDVVLAPKQYSIFNNNPALIAAAKSLHLQPRQKNLIDKKSWARAEELAEKVVQRKVPDPTAGATHYIAPRAMTSLGYTYPKWSHQYKLVAVIDNHQFYKPFYPKKKK